MAYPDNHVDSQAARDLIAQRMRGGPLDSELCEREPIRVPGAIQPHGALIGLSTADLVVAVASANAEAFLGKPASSLLGQPAASVLPQGLVVIAMKAMQRGYLSDINPNRIVTGVDLGGRRIDCWAHVRAGLLLLEFEPTTDGLDDATERTLALGAALTAFRDVDSLSGLNDLLVSAVFDLTGYERVLVYRFDSEWNGTTIAERQVEGWEQPFLGLRFPASDIPRQARELYSENLLRLVPSRGAERVALIGLEPTTVDLSGAMLRSQSPVHLEYQRNIGVDGAMSASIIKNGKLWGLLVGHHRGPHKLPGDVAVALATLVNAYAMRLYEVEDDITRQQRRRQDALYARLLEQMAAGDDFVDALVRGKAPLHDLFLGGGAAIVRGDTVHTIGRTPPPALVRELAEALRLEGRKDAFSSDRLGARMQQFESHADIASGVLALPLRDDAGSMILWFRPEVASTVVWAGDPRKSMVDDADGRRMLPRRSFERWIEERRGFSAPWESYQIDAATALGFAIDEVIVRHARKVQALNEQLNKVGLLTAQQNVTEAALRIALQEKDSLLSQKDFLLREVDHRIRNSLTLISSILQLQARSVDPKARDQFMEASQRVATVAQVHQRLYQSGKLQNVELKQYLGALLSDISGSVANPKEKLLIEAMDVEVSADDAVSLGLIVNELVTNAFKHGRVGDAPLNVKVSVGQEGHQLVIAVENDGGTLAKDFDFTRATGLGMRIVSGLLGRLRGSMNVETETGRTRFVISMPLPQLAA